MKTIKTLCRSAACYMAVFAGCAAPPGQPRKDAETLAPSAVVDFATLYSENCAGCHGPEGQGGAAIALANPVYLQIVDESTLRSVIADGVGNTAMPAFAQRAGGMLTDAQIDILAREIRKRWERPDALVGLTIPSYRSQVTGSASDGQVAYQRHCSSCHGTSGQGTEKGSSITNDSFLALVSDQGLRTMIIAGRPELGAPDWRGRQSERPLSEQEVTDIVAWLGSHRRASPGQPYAASTYPQN